jgi:hypothetical protein
MERIEHQQEVRSTIARTVMKQQFELKNETRRRTYGFPTLLPSPHMLQGGNSPPLVSPSFPAARSGAAVGARVRLVFDGDEVGFSRVADGKPVGASRAAVGASVGCFGFAVGSSRVAVGELVGSVVASRAIVGASVVSSVGSPVSADGKKAEYTENIAAIERNETHSCVGRT